MNSIEIRDILRAPIDSEVDGKPVTRERKIEAWQALQTLTTTLKSMLADPNVSQGQKDWVRADLENIRDPLQACLLSADDIRVEGNEMWATIPLFPQSPEKDSVEGLATMMFGISGSDLIRRLFPGWQGNAVLDKQGSTYYFQMSMRSDSMEEFLQNFCGSKPASEKEKIKVPVKSIVEVRLGLVNLDPGDQTMQMILQLMERWNGSLHGPLLQLAPDFRVSHAVETGLDRLTEAFVEYKQKNYPAEDLIVQHGEFEILQKSTQKTQRTQVLLGTFVRSNRERPAVLTGDLELVPDEAAATQPTTDPSCSSCGRKLEVGPQVGSRQLYMGVVCASCGRIECSACKGDPNTAPCRWCKGEVKPAYDTYLNH